MTKMTHIKEFDKNAKHYDNYNIIQKRVAKELVAKIQSKPEKIVDLGCGSGTVYELISWEFDTFTAVDKSARMLALHPEKNVTKRCCDIEAFDYENYADAFFISASALQWCKDLKNIFDTIKNYDYALAIFTANTFASLHETAKTTSPIHSKEAILNACSSLLPKAKVETKQYTLEFDSTLAMLRYIKKSGVSGGKNSLRYSQIQRILNEYDKTYLEFEVVFVNSK